MNWLILYYALTIGVSPNSMMVIYPTESQTFYPMTEFVQMESELRIADLVFLGGFVRTEIQKEDFPNFSFRPEMMSYGFKAGMRKEGLEAGMIYACQHPAVPYFSYYKPLLNWEGWYMEAYVKVSGESKIF